MSDPTALPPPSEIADEEAGMPGAVEEESLETTASHVDLPAPPMNPEAAREKVKRRDKDGPPSHRDDIVIPDYTLIKRIGSGAYGEVWLAQSVTGALRAVKIVWREDFELTRTFHREFQGIQQFEPVFMAERARHRRIVEGHGDLRPEHVWLMPAPRRVLPFALALPDLATVLQDSSATTIDVLANDVDPAAGGLTLSAASTLLSLPVATHTIAIVGNQLQFTPAAAASPAPAASAAKPAR